MQLKSLGYRTDLIFPRFEGEIIDRVDYLVVLTPSNPGFFWGNFLLFDRPPASGDFERWRSLFAREVAARYGEVSHQTFGWDTITGETGEVQPFLDAGFTLLQGIVLTTGQVHIPPKYNSEVEVRPLQAEWEWAAAMENQIRCREPWHIEAHYRIFKEKQMARYRLMAAAGLGGWFGAFLGNELVADLGLYRDGDVGRFQSVETHPGFRRKGMCGALVYHASRHGFEQWGLKTLVMVADEDYHAAKIYESVGFQPTERTTGLEWWDKSPSESDE